MPKCEKCRERAATVFIKRVLDTQSTHSRLCEECAREQAISEAWLAGAFIPPGAEEMPLEDLLPELLNSAPDPEAFAPEEDKWSLQKLAAYDQLKTQGEFSSDEDLADDANEMDDEQEELSPEEIQAALDDMEPEEREAVNQMLEALDEVQEHLENIMFQHAQDLDGAPQAEGTDDEDDAPSSIQAFFQAELMLPPEPELGRDGLEDADPFEDDASDNDPFEDDSEDTREDSAGQDADGDEPLLPTFLLPGFLGFSEWSGSAQPPQPPEFKSAPTQRCSKCRMTWDRLREDGRAGCPSCYEMFEEALGDLMERGQNASHHIGKAPRAAVRRRRRLELLRARRDSRLAMLRERLKAALAAQQFEEAAKLRDKIKVVKSTIVEPNEGSR